MVQPVHLRQHTRAARARKSANMFSADMVSILPKDRRGGDACRAGGGYIIV